MIDYEVSDDRSLTHTRMGELKDQVLMIGTSTLLIPKEIRYQMRAMDQLLVGREYASEIFGVGLVKRGSGEIATVTEFIAPRSENIFGVNASVFILTGKAELMDMVSDAKLASLKSVAGGVILECGKEESDETTKMPFFLDGQGAIDYSLLREDLSKLFNTELPPTIDELNLLIARENAFQVEIDFDAVVAGTRAIMTRSYMRRIRQRVEETGLDIGFTVHHHPSLALAAVILESKGVEARRNFYHELLTYSENDLKTMQVMGADFFEIRAFGNLEAPFNPSAGVTSRYYKTTDLVA